MKRQKIKMIAEQLERGIDPSENLDRLHDLKTSELFRVALGAAVAHDEAMKDAMRFTGKIRQVVDELTHRYACGDVSMGVPSIQAADHDLKRRITNT